MEQYSQLADYCDNALLLPKYCPVAQSCASVLRCAALASNRAQSIALGETGAFSPSVVNEVHFSFMRDFTNLGQPQGGQAVSLVSQGIAVKSSMPIRSKPLPSPSSTNAANGVSNGQPFVHIVAGHLPDKHKDDHR